MGEKAEALFGGGNKAVGNGITNSNIVGYAFSVANNTDAENCMAQSNAAVVTAGGDIESKQWNQTSKQED